MIATVALLTLGGTVHATTYFVRNGGNDGAVGTSDTTAWATITGTGGVNSRTFLPGDTIQFKRGSTWTGGGLVVNQSGTSDSARITYGAYGTGNKPVFANMTGAAVTVTGKNYVTVQDLTISAPAGGGVAINNGNFVTILRVDVSDNGAGPAINAVQGGNVLIDSCTVTNAWSNGIQFKGSPAPNQIHDSTIQNCVVLNTRANDGIVIHAASTSFLHTAGSNFVIRNNRSEGSFENGYDITTGSNILLEGNTSKNNEEGAFNLGHSANNVTVRYHWAEDEPTRNTAQTVKVTVPDVLIEYCVFIGSTGAPTWVKPVINIVNNGGLSNEPNPENLTIRNNTVIWNHPDLAGNFFSIGTGVAIQNLVLKNNIFASRTGMGGIMNFGGVNPPNSAGFAIDNNLYYGSTATRWNLPAGSNKTFAEYRSLYSQDDNGKEGNPLFVNAGTGDFHLSSTSSPAYNAAENIGLSLDFDGVSVPQGGARDIGAFEFPSGGGSAPAAPASLTAAANAATQVDLSWPDVANETGYRIQRKTGAGAFGDLTTKAANATSHSDTTVAASTSYTYQIRAENGSGNSAYTVSNSVTTPAGGGGGLPSPWVNADIGAVGAAGGATFASGTFTIDGSGADIYGTADELHYVYQPVSGDCTIIARVDSVENTHTWAKAGVMIRETLAAGSKNAALIVRPDDGVSFQYRTATGGTTTADTTPTVTTPSWVRLVRAGSTFTASRSTNGTSWTTDGTITITMGASVLIGLPVTSHSDGTICTATISNVTVTGGGANSVPSITTTTLPGTIVGESYNQTLAATGGDGTLVWNLDSGALPAGLSLSSGGVISGSATTAGTANFTVKVADSDGITGPTDEDTQALSIVVTANTVPAITTTTLPAGTVGTAYSQTLAATGGNGSLVWSLDSGTLPAGLSLSSAGVISGTPTTAATSNFTVRVADSDGNTGAADEDTQALSIVINSGASPVTYEAETLTVAGNSDSVQVVVDANASNGEYHLLNGNASGDFVSYTVNVATAGTYNVTTGITTRNNRGIYQLKIDGVNQGAAQDYYTAGSTTLFGERNLGTKTLTVGAHTFRFDCTGKNASANTFKQGLDYITLTPQ